MGLWDFSIFGVSIKSCTTPPPPPEMGLWDFNIFGVSIKNCTTPPPHQKWDFEILTFLESASKVASWSPTPPPPLDGTLGFYHFWTQHQKIMLVANALPQKRNGTLRFQHFWTQHQKLQVGHHLPPWKWNFGILAFLKSASKVRSWLLSYSEGHGHKATVYESHFLPLGQFSKITTDYNANSESSSRETSRPSSPESGNLTTRMLYSPLPEMAIVHRTMHDAIYAVREQQARVVTRSLLSQQRTLAANKLQCNMQIKRTSTPDPPSMSNVSPRQARARSMVQETVQNTNKVQGEKPITQTSEKAKIFHTSSSKSATDCPSTRNCTPGPSWRSNRTASEGDWVRPSYKKTSRIVHIIHRFLMGSRVKAIAKAIASIPSLTVQWGPMFFVSFSWELYPLKANRIVK